MGGTPHLLLLFQRVPLLGSISSGQFICLYAPPQTQRHLVVSAFLTFPSPEGEAIPSGLRKRKVMSTPLISLPLLPARRLLPGVRSTQVLLWGGLLLSLLLFVAHPFPVSLHQTPPNLPAAPGGNVNLTNQQNLGDAQPVSARVAQQTQASTATMPQSIDSQAVFGLGANNHLYVYNWAVGGSSSSPWNNWVTTDLTALVGPYTTTIVGTPSAHSFLISSGALYVTAYALGLNGHLYEYWWTQSAGWNLNDLNTTAIPPIGTSIPLIAGFPQGYSFTLPGSTMARHSVFVIDTNGHLDLFSWAEGISWTFLDLTAQTHQGGNFSALIIPSGHWYVPAANNQLYQSVYAVDRTGQLWEYWWTNGVWSANNLTSKAPLPPSVTAVGSPSGYSFTSPGSNVVSHHVFVLGSDAHIYDYK